MDTPPLDDRQRLLLAAIGFARQQLSEGQAAKRLQRISGGLTNEAALEVYRRAFELVAAGEGAQDLAPGSPLGFNLDADEPYTGRLLVEATITWTREDGGKQEWRIRQQVAGSDSVASVLALLVDVAENRNVESGAGVEDMEVSIDWMLPLEG